MKEGVRMRRGLGGREEGRGTNVEVKTYVVS